MREQEFFDISPKVRELAAKSQAECAPFFERIEDICEHNSLKVLAAFGEERISEMHLLGTAGYGYGDRGRDGLDSLYARIFGAQDALVRHHFACGTAAIATALFGLLRPGDVICSLTGRPYDTLHTTLGITGQPGEGSLREFGVEYRELALLFDGKVDLEAIPAAVKGVRIAYIQRSRGYSLRPSVSVEEIGKIAEIAKRANPDCWVVVDNCYGEFVEKLEPTQVGADLIIGSLIKNPGGGIARTGGYIAGQKELVERCAHRMTAPGLGREVGCSLDQNKNMYMGLFYAPGVVASAVKTAVFAAGLFSAMGYDVYPNAGQPRTDIIQSVVLGSPEKLTAFCRGIQKGAPIDSFVSPEAWEMPGYDSKVIMAAGAFNMGASIELSADGPMRPPYAAWMQGGLNYPVGKLGVMMAAEMIIDNG
ncbi:MAG: methionine gamma-lyase family protein [Oscillospiraceae bacterium]|nr:methionine gamma-lyase family protein [Oscillospiraceae bacterium]